MAFDFGFNCRSTLGFVTDPAGTIFYGGDAYPTSYTVGGSTVNAGFLVANFDGARDRVDTVDGRVSGVVRSVATASTFKCVMPESGSVDIYIACGDAGYEFDSAFDILDSDGSTVLYSHGHTLNNAGEFCDASGVVRTSAADWVTNNAKRNITPTNGTDVYVRFPAATVGSLQISGLSHIRFKSAAGGATVSTITGTTVTEAGNEVFTVTMSGTGGLTGAYSWTGSAGAADFTQTLTDGMFTTTGGSGSVTVSGGNIVVPSAVTAFTVTVPTTTDTLDEANETIRLVIGGVTSSSGTINDDDAAPTLTGDTSQTVTAGSPVVIAYSPGLSGQTRTYTLALTDGTATGGTDYDNTTVTGDFAVTAGTGSVSISGSTVTVDPGVTEFTLTITTTA